MKILRQGIVLLGMQILKYKKKKKLVTQTKNY